MTEETKQPYFLSKRQYDITKRAAQYWLPAAGTLYFALAEIWNFPNGEQVVGTIAALIAFLGVLLGYSSAQYNKSDARYDGEVVYTGDPDNPQRLVFNVPLSELEEHGQITLKVRTPDEGPQ